MSDKAIAVRTPETAIQAVEGWVGMAKDERKRRAAAAIQEYGLTEEVETKGDEKKQTKGEKASADLRSLLDAYTLAFSRKGVDTSPRTLSTYWRGSLRLLDWCAVKGYKPHSIGGEEAARFIASMGELAPKSRRIYLTGCKTLVMALRWVGMGKGDPFIMPHGAPIRISDPNQPEDKADPYTNKEIKKLLKGASKRERCLVLLGADGGLRLAEMCSLSWSGIDTERGVLKFSGKGSKMAKVQATSRLIVALEDMPKNSSGRVFGVSRRRMQQVFTRRCETVGVTPRGIHQLRHTCGTRLYKLTRDLLVVKKHLRHANTKTSEIYAHLNNQVYLDAVKALESNGYK